MRTYIKSSEFQSRSELLIIENRLPLTDEVTVDLLLTCLQHLHLKYFSIFSSGGHLVYRSGTNLANSVGSYLGNILMNFESH